MSVDLTKGATVELVKTLSDDLRTKSDSTKWESAGAAIRSHDADIANVKNDLIDDRLTNYSFTDNYYTDTNTYEPISNSSYSYATIDVSPYKNLHIRTHCYKTAGIFSISLSLCRRVQQQQKSLV